MYGIPAELSSFMVIDLVNNIQQYHDVVKGVLEAYCQNDLLIGQIYLMNVKNTA